MHQIGATIKRNDIKIENLKNIDHFKSMPKQAVSRLIKADVNRVQFLESEFVEGDGIFLSSSLHPFVEAVKMAYSDHLPLVISPDMIWYLITSGAATHINKNAEKLRATFVNHQGKEKIVIKSDQMIPWSEMIDQFASEISKRTNNGIEEKIVADFTTTNKITRIVSQIVLMDSMKQYFEYQVCCVCGIPEIRIAGTKQDWINLKAKTYNLIELLPDLKIWMKSLDEILNNFIDAFDDKIDLNFWNSIFKLTEEVNGRFVYGHSGPYLSGWIIALFPYLDREWENVYVFKGTWRDANERPNSGITTKSFESKMNQVPFILNLFGIETNLLFVGGLNGVKYSKDHALTPLFAYAVLEDQSSDRKMV